MFRDDDDDDEVDDAEDEGITEYTEDTLEGEDEKLGFSDDLLPVAFIILVDGLESLGITLLFNSI